jgi:hypothetical protein
MVCKTPSRTLYSIWIAQREFCGRPGFAGAMIDTLVLGIGCINRHFQRARPCADPAAGGFGEWSGD